MFRHFSCFLIACNKNDTDGDKKAHQQRLICQPNRMFHCLLSLLLLDLFVEQKLNPIEA